MESAIISEADWNQSVPVSDELTVHVLPARHFSGRGLKRNQTCGPALCSSRRRKFTTAAIAAGPHFKAIGEQFGEVDLAIMENGQYDQDWKYIHMMPEETAQPPTMFCARGAARACRALRAGETHWDDPYQRLAEASTGRLAVADADAGRAGLGRR
jgi:L-ascorbate metabolism protein UlaG (beta-lactamase superfamily)